MNNGPYNHVNTVRDECIDKHRETNHFYDRYLPYEFHLRMVEQVHQDFKHLLEGGMFVEARNDKKEDITQAVITCACWGHDLIEDTRCSYNDVRQIMGYWAADIVYACTNEKGKNRNERACYSYYNGIRKTTGAVFVKLCDRIANVQYSKMTRSNMFEMYRRENEGFLTSMGFNGLDSHPYWDMFSYLINLFNDTAVGDTGPDSK